MGVYIYQIEGIKGRKDGDIEGIKRGLKRYFMENIDDKFPVF